MGFYILRTSHELRPGSYSTNFVEADPAEFGEAPLCGSCGKTVGHEPWLGPYNVQLEVWGADFGDLAFGPGGGLLVSERFKQLYEQEGLCGLGEFVAVTVEDVQRVNEDPQQAEPPVYYFTTVCRSAEVDVKASGIESATDISCDECRGGYIKRFNRVVLKPETIGNEDLFVPRGLPNLFVVGERFKKFCDEHEILNADLIEAEKYSEEFFPWEKEEK
jgi:uncharacterized protein DUF1629